MDMQRKGLIFLSEDESILKTFLFYFDSIYVIPSSRHEPEKKEFRGAIDKGIIEYIYPVDEIASADADKRKMDVTEDIHYSDAALELARYIVESNKKLEIVTPVLRNMDAHKFFYHDADMNKYLTVNAVINELPVVNAEGLPLEQILDYKLDPDSKSRFLALRNWMIDVSSRDLSYPELTEKLKYLLDVYEQHLKYHKLKYTKTGFQTVIITVAEIVENLTKLKFGKIAENLVSLSVLDLEMKYNENMLPGREVSYLYKTIKKFG